MSTEPAAAPNGLVLASRVVSGAFGVSIPPRLAARWENAACAACVDTGVRLDSRAMPPHDPPGDVGFCECAAGAPARARHVAEWNRRAEAAARARRDAADARLRALFRSAGIPAKYDRLTLETFRAHPSFGAAKRAAFNAAERFAATGIAGHRRGAPLPGFVLYGRPGTGKTGLAVASFRAFTERTNASGMYIEYFDLVGALLGNGRPALEERLDAARHAGVLLIDDLGDEQKATRHRQNGRSVWAETYDRQEVIFRLVNARTQEGRPTIVTTNLHPDDTADFFGPRTAQRLAESYALIELEGASYRFPNEPSL